MKNSQFEKIPKATDKTNFFDTPLDAQKVINSINEADPNVRSAGDKIFYSEEIDQGLNYLACSNGRIISFYIRNEKNEDLATFQFKNAGDSFLLEHRVIDKTLAEAGINGSKFLSKAEDILRILISAGNGKEIKRFKIDAAQVSVIKWAIKNGYKFQNPDAEKLFYDIVDEVNHDYLTTDEFADGEKHKNYIFRKDELLEARAYFIEKSKSSKDSDSIDLREVATRFELVKEI